MRALQPATLTLISRGDGSLALQRARTATGHDDDDDDIGPAAVAFANVFSANRTATKTAHQRTHTDTANGTGWKVVATDGCHSIVTGDTGRTPPEPQRFCKT